MIKRRRKERKAKTYWEKNIEIVKWSKNAEIYDIKTSKMEDVVNQEIL